MNLSATGIPVLSAVVLVLLCGVLHARGKISFNMSRNKSPPLTLYGHPWTRASRCLWMLRELGINFELKKVPLFSLDFDHMNPNRKQPFLHDPNAEAYIFESMAINLHLVEEYGGGHSLAPQSAAERAAIRKWTVWAATELDMLLFEAIFYFKLTRSHPLSNPNQYMRYFDRQKVPERLVRIKRDLKFPLDVLNSSLESSTSGTWLTGNRFTAADLNVASVAIWTLPVFGYSKLQADFPNIAKWLSACLARRNSPVTRGAGLSISRSMFSEEGMVDKMKRGEVVSSAMSKI